MTGTPRGRRLCLVTLEAPTRTPAPGGGYTEVWAPLVPATRAATITAIAAPGRNGERPAAGTVTATAAHVITVDYHPQITHQTRVTYQGQIFSVVNVEDVDLAHVTHVLTCVEVRP